MQRAARAVGVLLVGLAVWAGIVGPAAAHDFLVSSNPANGSTVTSAVTSVALKFNDIVLTKPSAPDLVVTGPDGRHYETGCATSIDRDVTVPVKLGPDGRYVATWRIVSADGHPVSASIGFTFKAPTGFSRAAGDTTSACAAHPASSPATSVASGGSAGVFAWSAAGILLLMVAAIAWRLWSVRRPE